MNERALSLPTKETEESPSNSEREITKIPLFNSIKELVQLERNPRKNKKIVINLTGTQNLPIS